VDVAAQEKVWPSVVPRDGGASALQFDLLAGMQRVIQGLLRKLRTAVGIGKGLRRVGQILFCHAKERLRLARRLPPLRGKERGPLPIAHQEARVGAKAGRPVGIRTPDLADKVGPL
jgi:hypothetical protein